MADLALALAKPAAASPIAAMLAATPSTAAKGAVPASAADPFAILMAAAAPATPTTPLAAQLVEKPKLADVSEKTGDGETAKEDGDKTSDPDALLALLTTPAPLPAPVQIAQPIPIALPAAIGSTPDAPVTKDAAPIALPTVLAQAVTPIADSAPVAPTTQTSIQALVQMMTTQADSAAASQPVTAQVIAQTAPQPIAAVVIAQAAAPVAGDAAAPAVLMQATSAVTDAQAKPVAGANARLLTPKLDGARTTAKSATTAAQPEARKTAAEAKSQRRDRSDTSERAAGTVVAQMQQADAKTAPREAAAVTATPLDIGSTDAVVTRHLAVAKDGQWLDSLAKDIAATGGNTGSLSFTFSPENLGALKVDITQGSDGASVHMTTDTDTARNIILDAQPRLAAEARAQGLTLKETSVSTNSDSQRQAQTQQQASAQSNNQQPGQDRRAFAQTFQQPSAPILSSPADKESDGELYA